MVGKGFVGRPSPGYGGRTLAAEPLAISDGIQFNRDAIEVSRIKEDADYEGVRVQFHATLARARIPMQLDIGFGDVIIRRYSSSLRQCSAPIRERPSLRKNWKRSPPSAFSIAA
jgi:hypothetical protein